MKPTVIGEPKIKEYYNNLFKKTKAQLSIASKAKKIGIDPSKEIEPKPVRDLADRTESIIGPPGVAKRYREIYKEKKDRMQTIFQIFEEIITQKWCKIEDIEKRVEQAIKTCLVLNTEGVVIAPLDGVPKIIMSENPDGSKYIDIYYAGPIRAAGGTSAVLPLILGDYARKILGIGKYIPTLDEIERYVEEIQIYSNIVSRQYKITDNEIRKIVKGCPVCINGEPTEEREVAVHRDIKRINHNRIRGGMCLVISEGIALKAMKILKFARMLGLNWDWLEDIIKYKKPSKTKKELEPLYNYLEGTAAGRPILSYPSRIGGFRLRYGRSTGCGIMAKAIHPATMTILEEFIAIGTQLKVERPGKAGGICACDTIEGPIVKLKNGDVKKIKSRKEALKLKNQIKEILFLGDILVPYGDFKFSAHPLIPAGYCQEWWAKEAKNAMKKTKNNKSIHNLVDEETSLKLSIEKKIPLHPAYIYYYNALNKEELLELTKAIHNSKQTKNGLLLEKNDLVKNALEKAGIEHLNQKNNLLIQKNIETLKKTFGFQNKHALKIVSQSNEKPNKVLSRISGIKIRDKCGTFIGARMGRPEASTPRQVKGNPHILFPIGNYGTNTRSINKAIIASENHNGRIEVEICNLYCQKCNKKSYYFYCQECGTKTRKLNKCFQCNRETTKKTCPHCQTKTKEYQKTRVNIRQITENACKKLGVTMPSLVKGVKGMINKSKIPEPIEKGILRARHDVHIFKDGTIRYEAINNPITHFKPKDINQTIENLKKLGYTKDYKGKKLVSKKQIIEIFPQDIILNEQAGDFFLKVSKFLDEELEKIYKTKPFYNAKKKEDLIGQLFLGLAPHTSAAIIGRLIGYSKARACFAHPYFHQTKRRNADGDQDSVMLLMDSLLNFSYTYLPDSRGGRMDAPLVFTIALNPIEIDDEVHNMEICDTYPLKLYEKAKTYSNPDTVNIKTVKDVLGTKQQYSGIKFTHKTTNFFNAPTQSKYVRLKSMEEKIRLQAKLQYKIRALNKKDSLERVLATHFFPDIVGNTRSFSRQKFRCTNCNTKYRRPPLTGKCIKCSKGNIILTIAHGSVTKYLEIAEQIINEYNLSDYLKQRINLIKEEINSIFKNEKKTQTSLAQYI